MARDDAVRCLRCLLHALNLLFWVQVDRLRTRFYVDQVQVDRLRTRSYVDQVQVDRAVDQVSGGPGCGPGLMWTRSRLESAALLASSAAVHPVLITGCCLLFLVALLGSCGALRGHLLLLAGVGS
ncbi:Tetraspanin-12 [Liparis tanakae]|uniref:Tetraspanin-12 n=1 Tax=Liparis tanakae TaxID=230148 RepID=A0A4Z2FAH7_9TELE|nr:Tetraspanin-12 [Liparis tanakae]